MSKILDSKYSSQQIQECIQLLQHLSQNPNDMAHLSQEEKVALLKVTGEISRPTREEIRRRGKARNQLKRKKIDMLERSLRAHTGIRRARTNTQFVAPKQIEFEPNQKKFQTIELVNPRDCYVCKKKFTKVHFFYDSMCPECAEFNYAKRFQTADLSGQTALITGSRLKIGYQASLMMLRAGAQVIATTRFPVDSALRYSKEEDYTLWKDRLHIYGLDLRHTPSVEIFCNYIKDAFARLDLLVNNAAQTVRRPPGFYAHMMKNEALSLQDLPVQTRQLLSGFDECKKMVDGASNKKETVPILGWNTVNSSAMGISSSAQLSQIPYTHDPLHSVKEIFPEGKLDADLQQVDLRTVNSWRLRLGEIETAELIELQLVNAIAPFVLCNKLLPMMKRDNTGKKHIVNVSAMEGKFHRYTKTDRHPHTNMAKAALNMLTHTSASDLAKSGIYMNAVDTGWVTDEDPAQLSARKQEELDFQPPLDIVDGAARVCDPFFDGILTATHWSGKFLKDYFPVDW